MYVRKVMWTAKYRGADKSLALSTSRYILFDGENISFDPTPVIYVGESNENLKYFYLVIYWTQKVHNDITFLRSLHCVPYKCSSASEVYGYL